MDRMIRNLSMKLARATTRRDFLSGMAKRLVGLGFGAGFLYGARVSYAYSCDCNVSPPCNAYPLVNRPCGISGSCVGAPGCTLNQTTGCCCTNTNKNYTCQWCTCNGVQCYNSILLPGGCV